MQKVPKIIYKNRQIIIIIYHQKNTYKYAQHENLLQIQDKGMQTILKNPRDMNLLPRQQIITIQLQKLQDLFYKGKLDIESLSLGQLTVLVTKFWGQKTNFLVTLKKEYEMRQRLYFQTQLYKKKLQAKNLQISRRKQKMRKQFVQYLQFTPQMMLKYHKQDSKIIQKKQNNDDEKLYQKQLSQQQQINSQCTCIDDISQQSVFHLKSEKFGIEF